MSRALIASRTFVPEVNAAAFRLGALARAVAGRGLDVEVITTVPPQALRTVAEPADMRVRRWPVLRDSGGNVRGYVQYLSYDVPLMFRILFRGFDVAVAEAPPTTGFVVAIACALRRRPFVYYAADVWTDGVSAVGSPSLVIRLMRMLERTVLRSASRILSVSDGVSRRLVQLGAHGDRIDLVGHGIDTAVFSPDIHPAAEDAPYFVYTGTMSEVHRPQAFVEAFASLAREHPTVRLKFFGQGVFESELRALAERCAPGRVDFGGVVPPTDVAPWIRGAAGALVSLAPGIGYDYAHPTKAYAAAACGTPVLFSGAREFGTLIDEAGLGIAVGADIVAVVDAMRRLLREAESGETESRRAARASWAREHVSLAAVGDRAAAAVLSVLPRVRRLDR